MASVAPANEREANVNNGRSYSNGRFLLLTYSLYEERYRALAVVVQLHQHDLLPNTFHQFTLSDNHCYRARQNHRLGMRVAVDALVHHAAGVGRAQVRVALAFGVIYVADVVVPVVFFRIRKPIQHPREVGCVSEFFVGANEILLILVYPNARRGVVRLDGNRAGVYARGRNRRFDVFGNRDELLSMLGLVRLCGDVRGGCRHRKNKVYYAT